MRPPISPIASLLLLVAGRVPAVALHAMHRFLFSPGKGSVRIRSISRDDLRLKPQQIVLKALHIAYVDMHV